MRPAGPRRSSSSPAGSAPGCGRSPSTGVTTTRLPAGRGLERRRPAAARVAMFAALVRHDLRGPDPGPRELPHRWGRRRGGSELLRDPGDGLDGDHSSWETPGGEARPAGTCDGSPSTRRRPPTYATTECHSGPPLDLHPEDVRTSRRRRRSSRPAAAAAR